MGGGGGRERKGERRREKRKGKGKEKKKKKKKKKRKKKKTCCVDGLENTSHIHTTSNLTNKMRGHSLLSNALVNTEEVDFHHSHFLFVDTDGSGDTSDETDEFLGAGGGWRGREGGGGGEGKK